MDLGARIAGWRKSKGLSERELAEKIGVTAPAVYQWEDGKTIPSTKNLMAIAELMGVTMERFYGRVPPQKRAS